MTEIYHQRGQEMQHGYQQHNQHEQHWGQSRAHQIAKAATAVTAGGSLLVLSGLTLAGTVIALTVATPLLVIFSPVLVPAVITAFVLAIGFLTSGGLGVAAATVLAWMYRYVTGRHPTGADSLDEATHKLGSKAREYRDRSEHAMGGGGGGGVGGHYGTHHTTGTGVGHH